MINPGALRPIAVALGVALLLTSAWCVLWLHSSSSLRCLECDCTYSITSANPRCRLPAVLLCCSASGVAMAAGAFVFAWVQHRGLRSFKHVAQIIHISLGSLTS